MKFCSTAVLCAECQNHCVIDKLASEISPNLSLRWISAGYSVLQAAPRNQYYENGITLIQARICNHMPSKVWDEITYPFPYFNGCTVDWEWISNFMSHFIMRVTVYQCFGLIHVVKGPQLLEGVRLLGGWLLIPSCLYLREVESCVTIPESIDVARYVLWTLASFHNAHRRHLQQLT